MRKTGLCKKILVGVLGITLVIGNGHVVCATETDVSNDVLEENNEEITTEIAEEKTTELTEEEIIEESVGTESDENGILKYYSNDLIQRVPNEESELLGVSNGQNLNMAFQVLEIINQHRSASGLNPLTMDKGLLDAAQLRATEIVNRFSHTRPDGTECFSAFPSGHWYVGENIAAGYGSASSVMKAWMNSSGHKQNIMNPDFESVGIACYYVPGSTYGYYWVQCFGTAVYEEVSLIKEVENTGSTVAMYRMYNPNSGEHFYTAVYAEAKNLVNVGWNYEGIAWYAPKTGDAVYRLYNPNAGDHHYTTSLAEKNHLVSVGWRYEGIAWYSGGSVPLYRAYNPNAIAGAHHYTTSKGEINTIVAVGWKDEGIGWYGVK